MPSVQYWPSFDEKAGMMLFSLALISGMIIHYFQLKRMEVSPSQAVWLFVISWTWKVALALIATYLFSTTYAASDMLPLFEDAQNMGSEFGIWWQSGTHLFPYMPDFFFDLKLNYAHAPRALFFSWILAFPLLAGIDSLWQLNILITAAHLLLSFQVAIMLQKHHQIPYAISLLAFLFIPGIAIWHSALFKESLAMIWMLGIALCLPKRIHVMKIKNWFGIAIAVVLIFGLYFLKYYLAILFLFLITSYFTIIIFHWKWWQLILALIFISFISGYLHPNLSINYFFEAIRINHSTTLERIGNHSSIIFKHVDHPVIFYMYNIPLVWALFFLNPLLSGFSSALTYAAIPEKVVFTFLFISLLANNEFRGKLKANASFIIFFGWAFISCGLLAYASPNAGALLRYQSLAMPVAWIALLYQGFLIFPTLRKVLANKTPIQEEKIHEPPRVKPSTNASKDKN